MIIVMVMGFPLLTELPFTSETCFFFFQQKCNSLSSFYPALFALLTQMSEIEHKNIEISATVYR